MRCPGVGSRLDSGEITLMRDDLANSVVRSLAQPKIIAALLDGLRKVGLDGLGTALPGRTGSMATPRDGNTPA